jgi:hypothetical protein
MNTILKLTLISTIATAAFSAAPAYGTSYSLCEWKDQDFYIIAEDPFNAGNSTGPTPVVFNSNPLNIGKSCMDLAWPGLSTHFMQLVQGMSRYAEEYDQWAEAHEKYEDMLYVQSKYNNRNDDTAYTYVGDIRLVYDTDNDGNADYIEGSNQIIIGADDDNNGLIDILEITNAYNIHGSDLYYGQY